MGSVLDPFIYGAFCGEGKIAGKRHATLCPQAPQFAEALICNEVARGARDAL
jgi:hypothetical protein